MFSCKSFHFYLDLQQICLNIFKALNSCSRGVVKTNKQAENNKNHS